MFACSKWLWRYDFAPVLLEGMTEKLTLVWKNIAKIKMQFGLVRFYGISTLVGYLIPDPLYTYIPNIYDLVLFCFVLWHINHCGLFNGESYLYIYIKYIWFGLVEFYGISTLVGHLIPNPVYSYILNIYDLKSQVNKVKCFQVLLFTSSNSIKHQPLVSTQLNGQSFFSI